MDKLMYGTPFSATATGSSTATATVTGVPGVRFFVTDVTGSSDLAGATIQIKSGSTVIWQDRISNTAAYEHQFAIPLPCTAGSTLTVVVTGTSLSNANVSGVSI